MHDRLQRLTEAGALQAGQLVAIALVLDRRFAREHLAHDVDVLARARERARSSAPYQPSPTCGPDAPRPSTNRPPERWSSVSAAIAIAVGVRADSWAMAVPSRIRS